MRKPKRNARAVAMNSKPELRLDWIERPPAEMACKRWHYSRTIPMNKSARIGVWEGGEFVGVIIYGLGASPSLGSPYGLGIFETCELTRVALRAHHHPVSRMLAISLRMIRKNFPGLRLIVSFADQRRGHHGGIYQATNWIYAGETKPAKMIKLANGDLVDLRRFNGHGHNASKPIPDDAEKVDVPPKYRYLMPLDLAMREQISALSQEYPKRVK